MPRHKFAPTEIIHDVSVQDVPPGPAAPAPASAPRPYDKNPHVVEIPAACPRCGSTRRGHVSHTTTLPDRPLTDGVRRWPGRIIRRVRCASCNRAFIVSVPFGDPVNVRV